MTTTLAKLASLLAKFTPIYIQFLYGSTEKVSHFKTKNLELLLKKKCNPNPDLYNRRSVSFKLHGSEFILSLMLVCDRTAVDKRFLHKGISTFV